MKNPTPRKKVQPSAEESDKTPAEQEAIEAKTEHELQNNLLEGFVKEFHDISDKIKELRKKKGISQLRLATDLIRHKTPLVATKQVSENQALTS